MCHFCHSTGRTEQRCTVWEGLSKGTDPGAGISGGHLGGWPPWCLRRPRCSWEAWRTEAHTNRWALFSRLRTSLPGAGRLIWPRAWRLGYNFICLNPPPCLTVSPSYGHTVPSNQWGHKAHFAGLLAQSPCQQPTQRLHPFSWGPSVVKIKGVSVLP